MLKVRLNEHEHKALQDKAQRESRPLSEIVRELIRPLLDLEDNCNGSTERHS